MKTTQRRTRLWFGAVLCLMGAAAAQAQVVIGNAGQDYVQNFDTLTSSGTAQPWANNLTLQGWNLFVQPDPGAPMSSFNAGDGSSNSGSFYSFGTIGSSDRALGGVGSGGTYFGTPGPASGAVAGWIAADFQNLSGQALTGFTLNFDGEQWRNGGNTDAQPMVLEYGFGSSFGSVSNWIAPGAQFDWSSPVTGATAAAVDGNAAGKVANVGGTVDATWAAGDTLWIRWTERNDIGNDHGLAIDNFSLTAGSVLPVPEAPGGTLVLGGAALLGWVARRRARQG